MKRLEQRLPVSKRQRGIVLLITLLVLIAMTLASVGMMRSVDTSVAAVSNMAFTQAADAAAGSAIECVIRDLRNTWVPGLQVDRHFMDLDGGGHSEYYASIQDGEDARGIPAALLQCDVGNVCPTDDGNTVRYLFERMCNEAGEPKEGSCFGTTGENQEITTNKTNEFVGWDAPSGVFSPFYRVSVCVSGPKNTVSFVQAIINL
jgi:hypothetical protein